MFKDMTKIARLVIDHNAAMKIKQFGPRTELYAFSLTYHPVLIEHCSLSKFLAKGYLGQSSFYPHEVAWPVASIWSSKKFHTDEEAYEEFLKDCAGTGAHTKITWESNGKKIEKIFEWEYLE